MGFWVSWGFGLVGAFLRLVRTFLYYIGVFCVGLVDLGVCGSRFWGFVWSLTGSSSSLGLFLCVGGFSGLVCCRYWIFC